MKTLFASLLVGGVILVGFGASGVGASVGPTPAGVVSHFGSPTVHRTVSGNVPPGCGSITCAAYEAGVNGFLQDVAHDSGGGNNVFSADTQYSDSTGSIAYSETFGGMYIDTNSFPANGCTTSKAVCLTDAQLQTELSSDLTAAGWSTSSTSIFAILLPADVDVCFDGSSSTCATNAFCAYHSMSGTMIYAVEPFNTSFGCDGSTEPTNPQGFPNGPEIDETVNTTSHELNEAITDPDVSTGWYSSSGNENGDLCAWWFGAQLGTTGGGQPYNQVINGHDYSLQQEFSNAANLGAGGCVQQLGGTATTASPYVGDAGPLVWHNGPVMRSVTTHTVYWIPSAVPALSTSPVVTGTAATGHQLSTSNGTWTNSPTSYQYKWQRCNNTGTGCVDIPSAAASTYTLVAADAGHEIRSEVLANNGNGNAANGYAPSLTTGVVIGMPSAISKPTISGKAQVGKALSVKKGSWTYAPSFTYQWLRCSGTGKKCVNIKHATKSKYTLQSADAGHKLEARVTATNAAGSTSAFSGKTSKVTK